ncbi:aminotransferase class V-fold PLP-dependent enzyme [Prevotella sp. OH937_COT-195]|uniref:aminotransferase class V-fold PLP-dependent enzyme n=1 Tax=Prevotella sp. OH937_COT-195 TaxID=2491051 RepID=UPI000F65139C|nr:cysteine desulfurase [Prevotella sp. OH937_COT-195]RRC98462.1 cysteine desulfurase [Prevotella sp. OH937_COT-195]
MYDINKIREDFPILSRKVYDRPLVYLDNAATTQKPRAVIDAMTEEYFNVNANVHRGVHYLSQQATDLHEAARERVRRFINAEKTEEIIFTRGTTESLNLVASSFAEQFMKEGDEVIVSVMEHHSNIVPWQLQAERRGIRLRVIPMTDDGRLRIDKYEQLFSDRTKIVSVVHVSNALGTINPVGDIIRIAHEHGVPVMIDGAQSTPHFKVNVQKLDCDFFAFSGHKMYGPTGIGVLYGKEQWLEQMPPYQGGGEMIDRVTFEHTTFERLPFKFEAGTPDYVATHGLACAADYLESLGMDNISAHEHELTRHAMEKLGAIDGLEIYGKTVAAQAETHDAVISFNLFNTSSSSGTPDAKPVHHLDVGTLLDRLGIAVRTGHHCAQPLMDRLGILGTVRASFALYNTKEEIDVLAEGIARVAKMF